MPKLSRMVRGRTRGSQWIVGAVFACFASFLACSGDGPVSVPDFDPLRSSLSVAPGPYVAGESYLATFTARNTDGEPFTAAVTVTLSLGGGGSNGTFSAVTAGAGGVHTATFSATTAGTPSQVRATVNGTRVVTAAQSVTVVPGAVSATTSTMSASAPTIAFGASATLTVTSRDALSNVRSAGGDAVLLGKGAGTSDGTFSPITDNANGTYTATFTGTTTGSARTITATIAGLSLTSTLPAVSVLPPPPSLSQSLVSAGRGTLASGDTTTVTLSVRDAAGAPLAASGLVVTFSKGTGTSDGTISAVTDRGNGTYTALFTATLAGSARALGATLGGAAITSPAPTITVTPGAAAAGTSTVTVGSAILVAGASATVTLTLRDAAGNRLTSGGQPIVFTMGGGTSQGSFSLVTDHGDGTHSTLFTATVPGTPRSIGATIGGVSVTTALPTITVSPGALSLAQSTLTAGAATLVSGTTMTLTFIARDREGNQLTTGGATVAFVKGSGTSDGTISGVIDNGNGTYGAVFTATTAGTARTLSATVDAVPVTSLAPTIAVTPGAPSPATSTIAASPTTLFIGDTATLALTARDAAGNLVGTGGATVAFTKGAGTSDGTIGAATDLGDGRYRALFTATASGSTRAVGATLGGIAIAAPSVMITVSDVPPSLALSTVTVGTSTLTSGAQTTLTLVVRDATGTPFTSGGLTVGFVPGAGTSAGSISATTDRGDGTYSATFTAITAGTARAIGATIGGAAVTSTSPTITVTPGAASLAQSVVTVGSSTLPSGQVTTLTLTTRDAAGNALTTGGLVVAFIRGAGSSDGTISAVADNANGVYTATFTATTAGTTRAIGATVGGQAITSIAPTITVTPGARSLAQSSVSVGATTLASGASTTLTLVARDAAANRLASGGLTVLFTKGAGVSDGTISAVTDSANGAYAATFTATISGSARAIGATIGGEAVTAIGPTITVTPGVISAASSTISAAPTTILLGQVSTLTLTGRDAADNRVTSGGATVVFTKVSGFADGPLSAATNVGDGTYTATFTAATGGAPRVIGATINGAAVTTTLPVITVSAPPLMALASDSVLTAVQINTAAAPMIVAVANIGGGAIGGLSGASTHLSGPASCSSVNWLAAPTFDKGGIAEPVSLMTLQANATGLELGTCVRRVVVSSTTPSVAPETLLVAIVVGRSTVATGVVNVVMMGSAANNVVQTITPTPILRIDNGGRGTVTNLTATIVTQSGFAECIDPFDQATCTPWLAPSDLVWSSPTLPSTLSIVSQVRPFTASATIRVAGSGMASRDFQVNVAFNVQPELVTNPRNLVIRGLANRAFTTLPIMAFNQNAAHPGLTNFRVNIPVSPTPPAWLTQDRIRWLTVGDSGRLTIDIPAMGETFASDTIEILADCTNPNLCAQPAVPKRFKVPYTVIVERGIGVPYDSLTVFAADSTPIVVDIPVLSLGASEYRGRFDWTAFVSTPWITAAAFLGGGTSTPTTLRLTLDPRLVPVGDTFAVRQIQITKYTSPPVGLEFADHTAGFVLLFRRLP